MGIAIFFMRAEKNYGIDFAGGSVQEFKFATDRQLTSYVLGSKYIGEKLKENGFIKILGIRFGKIQ